MKTLHNAFPPTSHAAPKLLTATLMLSPYTKRFLKCTCQSRLTECSHMGKANLPENAAVAKQCQVVSLTSSAIKWFF